MAGNTDVNLPSPLVNILSVLETQFSTLSWQIYGSNGGATVRIRFGEARHASSHARQVDQDSHSHDSTSKQHTHTIAKYKKLSQKQIERDSARLQNFKMKMTECDHNSNLDIPDTDDSSIKDEHQVHDGVQRVAQDISTKTHFSDKEVKSDDSESDDSESKDSESDDSESDDSPIIIEPTLQQTDRRILRSHKNTTSEIESVRGYATDLVDHSCTFVDSSPVSDISKNLISHHSPVTQSPSQLSPLKDALSCADIDLPDVYLQNMDVDSSDMMIPVPVPPPLQPVEATDTPPTINTENQERTDQASVEEIQMFLDKLNQINDQICAMSKTLKS